MSTRICDTPKALTWSMGCSLIWLTVGAFVCSGPVFARAEEGSDACCLEKPWPRAELEGGMTMIDFTDRDALRREGRVILVAHRAGVVEEGAPACSLEAIRRAKPAGFDAVELDVRCSRDGVAILYHDVTLLKCGDGRPVADFTAEELTSMTYLDTEERIATMEQALLLCQELGLGVQLDFKDRGDDEQMRAMVHNVADTIVELGLDKATITISKGKSFVEQALSGRALFQMSPKAFDRLDREGEPFPEDHYVFGHAKDLPDELVKRMLDRGVMVMPSINTFHYLVDSDYSRGGADIRRLRAAGVWAFQIDSGYLSAVKTRVDGSREGER